MISPLTKRSRSTKRGGLGVTRPQPTTPIKVNSASVALAILTVEFDQPVSLSGVPKYAVDVVGADPISAALTTPTTLRITYDTSVAAATEVTIPYEEPAVRNASGGFVASSLVVI